MLVAYDGTRFKGFAAQPGQRTVAGELAAAIGRVVQHPVEITCAGRTDRGVHAWGQVIHVDVRPPTPESPADDGLDVEALARSCRKQLGPEIVVRAAARADAGFDARRSAVSRRYRYTIVNRAVPDPFLARFAWHVEQPLDLRAMELACDPFYGEHDFSSFCRRPAPEATLVRNVRELRWCDLGDGVLRFEIAANAFCHQMVRSIVGTLVEVGLGKKKAGDVSRIIRAEDRAAAGQLAPAQGLCLWAVNYSGD